MQFESLFIILDRSIILFCLRNIGNDKNFQMSQLVFRTDISESSDPFDRFLLEFLKLFKISS